MTSEPVYIAVYSLIGAILIIRLMNLRNKKEKLYFLATKSMLTNRVNNLLNVHDSTENNVQSDIKTNK